MLNIGHHANFFAILAGLCRLIPLIFGDERVVLDFSGVNVVTNSFADECIGMRLAVHAEALTLLQ